MKKEGYYSSGQFARMAHVTLRTIRYYDKKNILKPSYVTASGARFYTDADFARLQQILLLKYLGFSLDEIRTMTIGDPDYHFLLDSLRIQQKLVQDRIEQMQLVEQAIRDTRAALRDQHHVDWDHMRTLIHLTGMENSLERQYRDASNISARIQLHRLYSQNQLGWFPWLFGLLGLRDGMRILEVGCGDGALWTQNLPKVPSRIDIVLSDTSPGMLRDARRRIGSDDSRFTFREFDCARIPYPDNSFDLVTANHVLFYCDDIEAACREIRRVLKDGGRLVASAYGKEHMQEISRFVQEFDERIMLSKEQLYDRFGRENGAGILSSCFRKTEWVSYDDSLLVTEAQPLISYILSCHGNQNQYLLDRYQEFRAAAARKTASGFFITKDAGAFLCE
ncbi:MAG: methyltransferase domain-containing protein [Blautia sp.]|nr:methyltransferase domain-containing protein [Blautia sp.]